MNGAPPVHLALRRAGRRAQVAAAATDQDARELLELALDDNERFAEQIRALSDARDEMELDRDELAEKLQATEDSLQAVHRSFTEAFAAGQTAAVDEEGESPEEPYPEMRSVRDAVDAAVGRCPHLAFADRAFESAEGSPYEQPEDIFDALLKLERLAALWAREGGIGGMDLGQKAVELGLDWKAGVSQTARNRHDGFYTFVWDGEKRTMGPHIRLGSGSGAGRIARIYLDKHEPRTRRCAS